jgi:hypothetical protein
MGNSLKNLYVFIKFLYINIYIYIFYKIYYLSPENNINLDHASI